MAAVKSKTKKAYVIFLLPGVLIYGIFFIYPAINAFRVSLYKWAGTNIKNMRYVGLANFKELLSDSIFWGAFSNNIYILIVGGIVIIGLALFFAVALTRPWIKCKGFFQLVIFFPLVISGAGVGILWKFVYNPGFGALKYFLDIIGLGKLNRPWLGNEETALLCILMSFVWWTVGFYMLLYIAGIKRIPSTFYDAAKIDGASEWQMVFHITLPLLRGVLLTGILFWTVVALRLFDLVYIITQGGPGHMTETVSTYMYKMAFGTITPAMRLGYGTSIAVFLLIVTLGFSFTYLRVTAKETVRY